MNALEVTASDVAALTDEHLRMLVGMLAEATARHVGLSRSAVMWGGSQDAADGGIDVRVEAVPRGNPLQGFVPSSLTGFQVKKPDLGPAGVRKEMRPKGVLRETIRDLAERGGAYILVTAASLTDSMRQSRLAAMRDAVAGTPNAANLTLDVYDAGRLATWTRDHPGMVAWLRERARRAIQGWRPFGDWSRAGSGQMIIEGAARLREVGKRRSNHEDGGLKLIEGLECVRRALRGPGKSARLVGLSGVGKTRFAEALFDRRVGEPETALDPASALYTDLSHDPIPKPLAMAMQLLASGETAVLVVDNCPPDLHRDLAEACTGPGSTLSVLTVEYDIRDDLPEGTEAFLMDAASPEFVERLVARRFPGVSSVDAQTIGVFSGGNARVGLALASTIGRNESLAGLSDEALFLRLFQQSHGADPGLLAAAEACALVYSFDGVKFGAGSELEALAGLAGCDAITLYRHIASLEARGLIQRRARWRAVLPHAIANRLAERALRNIPPDVVEARIGSSVGARLFSSLCRRVGYLHQSPEAVGLAEKWMGPTGVLGGAAATGDREMAAIANLAPACPDATLSWAGRITLGASAAPALEGFRSHDSFIHLVRKLAYEPRHFTISIKILAALAADPVSQSAAKEVGGLLASAFSPFLSGTHAPVCERLAVAGSLLRSNQPSRNEMGLAALGAALEASHFSSSLTFDFGARPRDYGYEPSTRVQQEQWYAAVIALAVETGGLTEGRATAVKGVVAQRFPDLWARGIAHDALEAAFRNFGSADFWPDGWLAVQRTRVLLGGEANGSTVADRLADLERDLAPRNPQALIEVHVLHEQSWILDVEHGANAIEAASRRGDELAVQLGSQASRDEGLLAAVLPRLVVEAPGRRLHFAMGLAQGSSEPGKLWLRLVGDVERAGEQAAGTVLAGFLIGWRTSDPGAVSNLLDAAPTHPVLGPRFPDIQVYVGLDIAAVDRLKVSLEAGLAPLWRFGMLRYGGATATIPVEQLLVILHGIAAHPGGPELAADLLAMRFHLGNMEPSDRNRVARFGSDLLQRMPWADNNLGRLDYSLSVVAAASLDSPDMLPAAVAICGTFAEACARRPVLLDSHPALTLALFRAQPFTALDAFVRGNPFGPRRWQRRGRAFDDDMGGSRPHPASVVGDVEILNWCANDAQTNYTAAASFVPLLQKAADGRREWCSVALEILRQTPDPDAAIASYAGRLTPLSWSGSRAELLENNASMLGILENAFPQHAEKIERGKVQLEDEARFWREEENKRSLERDERFE